jgi:hypothetical protein
MVRAEEKEQVNCPFQTAKRLYFTSDQVEKLCEEALLSVNLIPGTPGTVRIDRFLEKKFGISAEYEELPPGVLGFTSFGADGAESVVVSRSMDEDPSDRCRRRVRSTLAHEAGHILLHTSLFECGDVTQLSLLAPLLEKPKVLCRDEFELSATTKPAYNGRWWEYQANMVIGALLIPRILMSEAIEPYLQYSGSMQVCRLDNPSRPKAIQVVSDTFDVNPVVAKIRVDELYPPHISSQLSI